MVPMFHGMPLPGVAETVVTIAPALVCLAAGVVAGLAWLGARWAESIRREAAREWESKPTQDFVLGRGSNARVALGGTRELHVAAGDAGATTRDTHALAALSGGAVR